MLTVQIEDKGQGFDVDKIVDTSGLAGMRERTKLLGGQLLVESRVGEGTRLTAELSIRVSFDTEPR